MHEQPPVVSQPDVQIGQLEQGYQPSLFEHFAEESFEYAGRQGTLRQLLNMCPVPAHQRSFAATEQFTADLVEGAGKEIPEQFMHLRSESSVEPKTPELEKSQKIEIQGPAISTPESSSLVEQVEKQILPESAAPTTMLPPETTMTYETLQPVSALRPLQPVETIPVKRVHRPVEAIPMLPALSVPEVSPPTPVTELLKAEEVIEAKPDAVTVVPDLEQYLGELYTKAARKVEEPSFSYNETTVTHEDIIDFLDLQSREATPFSGEELMLPIVDDEPILNLVSITPPEVVATPESKHELPILVSLPVAVTEAYATHMETLPVAEAEQLTELVETMSLIAERLHVLAVSERGDSNEAIQIEQVLEAYYDQLYTILKLPIDKQERAQFIAAIRSDSLQNVLETNFGPAEDDDGTHEFKRLGVTQTHQLPVLLQKTANLARYIMQLGVRSPHPELNGIL